MIDRPTDKAPVSQAGSSAPIATVGDFSRTMLEAAREMYQNEVVRREVAERIS